MKKLLRVILGKPRNPLSKETHKHIALIAFLAWIGLGADGLSSSCYGPEQAFYELGKHHHLAFYLAIATTITIFLISSAYNQVIRLFPNGGGGYKVATHLLGDYAGLVSGAALIIDYMLTIAISIASGTDAIFSMLPLKFLHYKLVVETIILLFLLLSNLRGAKESIKLVMPIFIGFFITHLIMIGAGILLHEKEFPAMIHATFADTHSAFQSLGVVAVLAMFMRAYSMGAGTYTGLEAVSNNVHILAEPRVKTGAWTMLYMAISLSIVAGGIILLYLLWGPQPEPGKTLNAVVFQQILMPLHHAGYFSYLLLMILEAGLLIIAANTGFLGGPAVLANMAVDAWVPKRFSMLSSRLVTQNGIIFFGLSALFILLATDGSVAFLVVLYSMNVFLTFSMSLLGLTRYWWKQRKNKKRWIAHITLSAIALFVCVGILLTTLITKFDLGGWITVVTTSIAIVCGVIIRGHYKQFDKLKVKLNKELRIPLVAAEKKMPQLNPKKPTAIFLVREIGAAMHCILWVQRMFPDYFKNFIFVSHGEVDIGSFGSTEELEKLKEQTDATLDYLVKFSNLQGIAAESYCSFGTDAIDHIFSLSQKIHEKYPSGLFFMSRYVYPNENWLVRLLHSDFGSMMQRRLHLVGAKMLILPLNLKT